MNIVQCPKCKGLFHTQFHVVHIEEKGECRFCVDSNIFPVDTQDLHSFYVAAELSRCAESCQECNHTEES